MSRFMDLFNKTIHDFAGMVVKDRHDSETYKHPMHWEVHDTLVHPDGRREVLPVSYNTVVNDCSKLIACLIKGQAGYQGAMYWAVGSGSSSWANDNPPSPQVTTSKLVAETFRKAIQSTDIVFLDDSNNVTASITNKIQISVTFLENEANGELREFMIVGGNATSSKDTGIALNHKIHPLIYKTSGIRLDRQIILVF